MLVNWTVGAMANSEDKDSEMQVEEDKMRTQALNGRQIHSRTHGDGTAQSIHWLLHMSSARWILGTLSLILVTLMPHGSNICPSNDHLENLELQLLYSPGPNITPV
jgi:hypothetical protein